ncbi:AAA family ATPase [Legionella sp. CNM-1927-20]|uniref:AAA family ATPase n=1 Tax=Legionella sp. CNM-1927-20 TaxID=3422221 RepID=UPI00403B1146
MPDLDRSFYFSETLIKEVYQDSPTGNIEVNELIKQKPYWISPTEQKRPKKLILADWSARNWSEEKIMTVIEKLTHLIDNGFSIEIWQNGKLVTLTKDNIASLREESVRYAITPAFPEEIRANNKLYNQENTLILDNYWISYLLNKSHLTSARGLKVSDYISLSEKEQAKVIAILQANSPFTHLIHDVFSKDVNLACKKLKNQFPDLKIIKHYEKIDLGEIKKVLTSFIKQGQAIVVKGLTLTQNDFRTITDIESRSLNIPTLELQALLTMTTELRRLKIAIGEDDSKGNLILGEDSLTRLESLILSTMTMGNIKALLKRASNLKMLEIADSTALAKESLLPDDLENLKNLEELSFQITVKETDFIFKNFALLMDATRNIKRLHLEGFYIPNNIQIPPFLEEFKIDRCIISGVILQKLFTDAPVKKICFIGTSVIDKSEIRLNTHYLEELVVNASKLDILTLNLFLKSASQLKKLTIKNIREIDNTSHLELEKESLSYLNEIDLSNTDISVATLSELLLAAPNLKKLNLNDCINLADLLKVASSLTQMEELSASSSNISSTNVQTILTSSPRLKKLNLANCENLSEVIQLAENSLAYLEVITLSGSHIHTLSLQALILASPNLRELNLSNCPTLLSSGKISQQNFSTLEILDFSFNKTVADNLQSILTTAVNLKKLVLSSTYLAGELSLTQGTLAHLERLELSPSYLTATNLANLLKAAPHIKELDLAVVSSIGSFELNLPELSLKRLEKLSLIPGNNSTIQFLLAAAPNLKTITLYGNSSCKLIDNLTLAEKGLQQLENITCSDINFSASALQTWLKATPNLNTLKLESCSLLQGQFDLLANSLPNLTELNLSQSFVSPSNLLMLLKASPKLTTLDISRGEALLNPIKILPNSLMHLREINLAITTISVDNLKALLKAAPNLKKIHLWGSNINDKLIDEELKDLLSHIEVTGLEKKSDVAKTRSGNLTKQDNTRNNDEKVPTSQDASPKQESIARDRSHNPADHREFIPPSDDFEFQFRGLNQTKNQGMIIEKLSQYLSLTNQHLEQIPKIQDGICDALSHFFKKTNNVQTWNKFIDRIANWDGKSESLTDSLKQDFSKLLNYVKKYQTSRLSFLSQHYLGDNLANFLAKLQESAILTNPWHAIAIKPEPDSNDWIVYDPNFVGGARKVKHNELASIIHQALGKLVSVETLIAPIKPKINDPQAFLEEGGLLTLVDCANLKLLLEQLTPVKDLSIPALEGLLLRDNEGIPAWVIGLREAKLNTFTQTLLQQFIAKIPDPISALQHSIAHLTEIQRREILTYLLLVKPLKKVILDKDNTTKRETTVNLADIIHHPNFLLRDYEKAFTTWKAPKSVTENLKSYCLTCVQPAVHKKRLIKVSSSEEVEALNYALEHHCQRKSRPVFRIEHPDDLLCASPFVAYDDKTQTGQLRKGPGGRFYDFLKANQGKAPVILVNYDRFSASDLVRFNSLLDETRKVDGIPLPAEDALVIGVINTQKPDCYQGSDFYSRFDVVETCPIHRAPLVAGVPELPVQDMTIEQTQNNSYIINLYQAPDWENQLLGHWVLDGDQLTFQKGELAKALDHGKAIELHNAPWQDDSFVRFWQSAYLRGAIQTPGPRLTFPNDIKLTKRKGYNWESLQQDVTFKPDLDGKADTAVLNPTLYSDFLSRYHLNGTAIKHVPGLIEAAKGSTLTVNLTRALSEHEWARLLSTCQTHQVKLTVCCAPGVHLPPALASLRTEPHSLPNWTRQIATTQVLVSSELDTTVAMVTKEKGWTVIDVSECKPSDLLYRLSGEFKKEELRFEFKGENKALLQALDAKKKVILKGRFSAELRDALAPLLIKRLNHQEPAGQLVLITDKTDDFHFANPQRHDVTVEEKRVQLGTLEENIEAKLAPYLEQESLSQLNARLRYLRLHPTQKNSDNAWLGLYDLPLNRQKLPAFNPKTSEAEAKAFTQARRNEINAILAHSPFVFLTGLSGVGKSTFVERELLEKDEGELLIGEARIEDWARSKKPGKKILFLDEANLSQKQFSEFEGLFNSPPTLLINGVLYELSSEHQVIFAGNPLTYGDERQLAPFFKRHGNAIAFSPLPPAVLYEKILKPVFANIGITPTQQEEISQSILKVYGYLCTLSTTDILITPRELQMMALLVMSQYTKNPHADIKVLTEQVIHEVAYPLVPTTRRVEFAKQFPAHLFPESLDTSTQRYGKNEFTITHSRRAIVKQLEDLLDLCELRVEKKKSFNEDQAYGGLGGIIIEGEPGIGKSELLQMLLAARGYQEVHNVNSAPKEKPFYVIAPSLPFAEKKSRLLQAFHEGAKVILEEINSSPMMEQLLNSLLMGKTPEGKRPEKPGFMVFGTQNPTTMAGRRAASTALSRRLITTTLTPYPTQEMVNILVSEGLPAERAKVMVQAFENQVAFATQHRFSPAPNFRDLIHLAKKEVAQLNNPSNVQRTEQILNSRDFLIRVIENYMQLRDAQDEVILPFQFTKEQKKHAAQQLINALTQPESFTFINSSDRKILLDGKLFTAIHSALEKEPGRNLHSTLDNAKKPFTSVNDLIDFLNQRNPKKVLHILLQDYKDQASKEGKVYQFFGQSKKQLEIVTRLLSALETKEEISIMAAEKVILMQGTLGDKIRELKASYERYNNTQLKDIEQLFNNDGKQPGQIKREQLPSYLS